ncbi:MAG: ferrous iron transporter B [Clostridiales bacterium]
MSHNNLKYDIKIEKIISEIETKLKKNYVISKRSVAILLIQNDEEMINIVRKKEGNNYNKIDSMIQQLINILDESPSYLISKDQYRYVEKIVDKTVSFEYKKNSSIKEFFNRITLNPISGFLILVLIIYFGFYKFVGVLGAGVLVDFIETDLFDVYLTPGINNFFNNIMPSKALSDLFVNDYGIITMGIKYAIAIVLPIVGCFFIMFSIIEDSGYLPRLSLLLDRVFKKIGLNGRAVIPMTLGFGCDTMATMVSRTLETKKERIISTILLALAIPCSAQLGVILALLSVYPKALFIWILVMIFIFLFIGYLSAKILPGEKPEFFIEVPPLRLPKIKNIIKKTYIRMYWYLREVLPLFILASVIIWIGNLTGVFDLVVNIVTPLVNMIGLPDSASEIFIFGFFRRDYGAAGLLDLQTNNELNPRQLLVAATTITLFIPCIAQFIMMIKERGLKVALAMAVFIIPFAFTCGYILNKIIIVFGVEF